MPDIQIPTVVDVNKNEIGTMATQPISEFSTTY